MSRSNLPVQCAEPGCPYKALEGARCPVHRRSRWTASAGYGSDWRSLRDAYIRQHPICEWPGCPAPSEEVDHIVRVKVDPSRRLDTSNLRALCVQHHRSRTGRDGARAQADRRARGERSAGVITDRGPAETELERKRKLGEREAAPDDPFFPRRVATSASSRVEMRPQLPTEM